MELAGLKLLFAAGVLATGWGVAQLPLRRAGSGAETRRLLGFGNAFATGTFLGIGLVHLLPEAAEAGARLGWAPALPFFLAAAAYLVMLLLEHAILSERAHAVVHAQAGDAFGALEGELVPYAVVVALSIHSLIAGLALGSQLAPAAAGVIFAALVVHKATEAFALGVSLVRHGVPRVRRRRLVAVFAAMTPLGIALATAASDLLGGGLGRGFVAGSTALAAGTFVYIASVEILRDEFLHAGGRLARWLCTAAGLVAIVLLAQLASG